MLIKPRHDQRWDGAHKNSAKECLNCNYHILIEKHDLCGMGEAFKYLIRTENPIKCGENQDIVEADFTLNITPTNTGANIIPRSYRFKGKFENESELIPTAILETKKILQDFGYECNRTTPG